jgi:rare lipoprotein A (peptidoglycan hydrolase)
MVKGRCTDLSKAGARALGFAGLVPVSVVPVVSD